MIDPSPLEIVWLAGLLEGEGSFMCGSKKYPTAIIELKMTDLDIIERVVLLWGKRYIHKRNFDNRKPIYRIRITGTDAKRWMELMYPYMGKRRQGQIEKAVSVLVGPQHH